MPNLFKVYNIHFLFYKQPIYKQLALGWQIAKHLLGLKPLSFKQQ